MVADMGTVDGVVLQLFSHSFMSVLVLLWLNRVCCPCRWKSFYWMDTRVYGQVEKVQGCIGSFE